MARAEILRAVEGMEEEIYRTNAQLTEQKEEETRLRQGIDELCNINAGLSKRNEALEKENKGLNTTISELEEFYRKEYFEIADRTADEKIKELEKYQQEITIDDGNPYDENSWGNMHEEWFVPKEMVRDILKETYALIEHQKKQITQLSQTVEKHCPFTKEECCIYDTVHECKGCDKRR